MNRLKPRLFPIGVLVLALSACDRGGEESETSEEEGAGGQPTNRVDIPSTVRRNLGITFVKVERRDVAHTIRVPGSFELQPLAQHEFRSMLPGRVEFKVDQFDEVKPGTILYRLRSTKWLELQAQIDSAKAELDQIQSKHAAVQTRIDALAKAEFKRADLEAQVAELRADVAKVEAEFRAALNNAARTLNLHRDPGAVGLSPDDLLTPVDVGGRPVPRYQSMEWIEVSATEPGVVESLAVTNGSFVEEATLLLTTVNPDRIRFRALGLQSDLLKFKSGQEVSIVQPQAIGSNLNESIEAELRIGLAADPDQRTLTLFATPKNLASWTRPGVSAFLEIASESSDGVVLAIPRSAIVKDGMTHVFFKRDPGNANKAIRVEADLGVDDGRWIEIKSDLGPTDEVVMNGAYELKLATSVSGATQKGGHFHADGTYHGKH